MATEQFTRNDFEKAVAVALRTIVDRNGYKCSLKRGQFHGEHGTTIRILDTNKRIVIMSSIRVGRSLADGTGENSIRGWVEYYYKSAWRPLTKGSTKWTTRVTGWEGRLADLVDELFKLALEDSNKPLLAGDVPEPRGEAQSSNSIESKNKENGGMQEGREAASPRSSGNRLQSNSPEKAGETETPAFSIALDGNGDETPKTQPKPKKHVNPNPAQLEAVEAPYGPVRILAGPGSGKTKVIEWRVARMVADGIDPRGIFAVTFSRDMADELYNRVSESTPEIKGTAADNQFCTIHALSYRILKDEGDGRRVPKTWEIKKTIEELADEMFNGEKPGWEEIYSWVSAAKAKGLCVDSDGEFFRRNLGDYYGAKLDDIREQFDRAMRAQNKITFADMLLDVDLKLQRDAGFREKWQARVEHMLIDEAQDTSGQAMRILTTLAAPQNSIFIVGDSDQLLYRFAGATPESNLFEGFESRYPNGQMVKLTTNYRSTRTIVETSLTLIEKNYKTVGGPYDNKYLKELTPRPDAPEGAPIEFGMFDDVMAEADSVTETILEELANGRDPGEIYVGARTRAQLAYLEGPLAGAKIPFVNITGTSFFTLKHIADVINYIRLAFDESNGSAFRKVYNIGSVWSVYPWGKRQGDYCPHRFLGRAFLSAVNGDYREAKTAFFAAGAGGRSRLRRSWMPGMEDLVGFVQDLQAEMAQDGSVTDIIDWVVKNCYEQYLRVNEGFVDDGDASKLDDLETLKDIAGQFETVDDFLGYVDEMVKQAEAAKDKDLDGYVVLSTIHRLKGQERDVVFGIGMAEGVDKRSGTPRGLLPHTFSLIPPPQMGILPTGAMGELEDERCMAFVLITRARERVYLSAPRVYRTAEMWASRFVSEIGLIDEWDQAFLKNIANVRRE